MSIQLHHEISGRQNGPVLVLSGSVGSSLQMWEPNLPALEQDFTIIRLDHRGHGGSPSAEGHCTIADLAGDALGTLDSLGVGQFHWCGLSMGAMLGMSLAADWPERVDKLVLCCTSAHFENPSLWTHRAMVTASEGTGALAEGIVERWFTRQWARDNPGIVEQAEDWVSQTSDHAYRACCEAIASWDHINQLSEIRAPTLVIAGRYDTATPVEHAYVIARGIPDSRLETVDTAHLATIEDVVTTNRLIHEHLCEVY